MSGDQQAPTPSSADADSAPGHRWAEIIRRPTLAQFAAAFTEEVTLAASVLPSLIRGAPDIRAVFDATREMYQSIAFSREENSARRTYLEWEGAFGGHPVAGATILAKDAAGLIESVRLYHSPLFIVNDFSSELLRRLAGKMMADVLRRP